MDLSPDEDNFQGRLLHQAALWDNVELLQELLANGADVNARDALNRTALHAAALAERSSCLKALCAAGADIDAVSSPANGGKTALHIAAERGHVENTRVLLARGACPTDGDGSGDSALALAERGAHRKTAALLRERKDAIERERLSLHQQLRDVVSSGDAAQLKGRLAALGRQAGLVVNMTPGGANTLLYIAAELGNAQAVSYLLADGADGRAHPITNYCPLYIACYRGHVDVAALMLAYFPTAAQQETVEKWLPLHAACIGGHPSIVNLLLNYSYPESMLNTYKDPKGRRYRAAFDINARDVSGQTALYVACTMGNAELVEALTSHTVPFLQEEGSPAAAAASPTRAGISMGIHAIVTRLTGLTNNTKHDEENRVKPIRVDLGRPGDCCLAAAIRGGHVRVVKILLANGADPDGPAQPPDKVLTNVDSERESRRRPRHSSAFPGRSSTSPSPARGSYSSDRDIPWTPLSIAAHNKSVQLIDMLLARGASDAQCAALRECARHRLEPCVASLLATKAFPDPDYKINKAVITETVFKDRRDSSLTYNSLCPTTPVTLNWRELRCSMAKIRMNWIQQAALHVNPKLGSAASALYAITRIDVSNNELRILPPELFVLKSLRHLNAAQNKLERLPTLSEPFEEDIEASKTRRMKKPNKKLRPAVYSAPVLQDLYLQDNRLEEIPPELFSLPNLVTLDISNNKLRTLPYEMWTAPRLKDLNAALNHLKDLPHKEQNQLDGASPSCLLSPSDSSSQLSASPSIGQMTQFSFNNSLSKSSSRSPSIERSVSEATVDEDDDDEDNRSVIVAANRAGNATWTESKRVHTWRGIVEPADRGAAAPGGSPLTSLNLSHNQFTRVSPVLACAAPALNTLNMAYNSLRSMSYVTSYPTSLRQLDLSHNEITCWPSLPQLENFSSAEGDPLACYCRTPAVSASSGGLLNCSGAVRPRSGCVREQLLSAACPARRHLTLEGLRTLILANNMLSRIQLTTDDDGHISESTDDSAADEDDEWNTGSSLKGRLLFPLLSMLDVSSNMLRSIPPSIHALTNLAVLNISGNKDITDLPPQMGLLSRLWNLNTVGCSLQEPLRSMVQSGKYRSMDIVGYLKSVLQEARPYSTCKLMIVGLQGIGKTSLLECLRQESAIVHRRKPTEHWAKRMGNKAARRGNMSTVGVDIGTWIYEKSRSNRPPVTFRTWDFGGQQEYYATHQYFLSRRSIYLVVWKVTDGKAGLAGAIQWLRSIQARAPGSPVIMVATHYDQVSNSTLPESESPEALQRLIRSSIMGAPDADKMGLPRVMDSVEVSCSTRHNIRLLADIIYTIAYSVKPPGSKEPMLEQRVPCTYLALEECVAHLAAELPEPVLKHHDYKRLVTQYMQQKGMRLFRDSAELHQATMFLHENGVLLHYDDATLKELYFLRPQWLCDVLAHVVTVREINPFASNGIMKIDDLPHVFKASPQLGGGEEAHSLGVSLLNKFELALSWDSRTLVVPPLLPQAEPAEPQLPLRTRTWSSSNRGTPRRAFSNTLSTADSGLHGTESPSLILEDHPQITITGRCSGRSLRRLLLLSYIPRGFWARLVTRLLQHQSVANQAYPPQNDMELDEATAAALELQWGWKLWQTGMKLVSGALTLVSIRQVTPERDQLLPGQATDVDGGYSHVQFRVQQDGAWTELSAGDSACIEIELPAEVCVARRTDGLPLSGYQSISVEPNPEVLTKLLALFTDHVDLLLEDWYPSLGTRFVHTSEGRCLITRLVPCPACLRAPAPAPPPHHLLPQALKRLELNNGEERRRVRVSEESRASDGDSGVGGESNGSSLAGSVDRPPREGVYVTAWTQERCMLAACTGLTLTCGTHGNVRLSDVAPDTLFLDVEESMRARWDDITVGGVAGRGAFGTVYRGKWRGQAVAVKALQPIPGSKQGGKHMQAAASRWERDPASGACRAYCALRQELGVLRALRHAGVVPLRAVCAAPLALLTPLAPMGALDGVLLQYRSVGSRVGARAGRRLVLQVARAIEYLHASRTVYRDLKSENVLVWAMPTPQEAAAAELSPNPVNVHIKLGDYGISRIAPPSGTKGFGGTEGFMAPEIMRYNGEEEYNEKVDCFSFGMLLYEVLTLRQPFEGHEAVKEAVLDGARPALNARDLQSPISFLALMRQCWSGRPSARPSAAALVSVAAAPEMPALQDAAATRASQGWLAFETIHPETGDTGWEAWGAGDAGRVHTVTATHAHFDTQYTVTMPLDNDKPVSVASMCRVGSKVWIGDSSGRLSVYSSSTCTLQWTVRVQDLVGGSPAAVSALAPLPQLGRVAVALECGRLFLVTSSRPQVEGSFVVTELGAATELICLAAVASPTGYEVFAGGSGLDCYSVRVGGVSAAASLPAPGRVTSLAAAPTAPMLLFVSEPACVVYGWCLRRGTIASRLDCSKLAPCSESLQSIALDDTMSELSHTVTALQAMRSEIYIGTAWGCVVVAEAATLRPITVFRPHEGPIRSIIPLHPHKQSEVPMIMTIGTGYRPLLQRFVPQAQNTSNATNTATGSYCLLWRALNWVAE